MIVCAEVKCDNFKFHGNVEIRDISHQKAKTSAYQMFFPLDLNPPTSRMASQIFKTEEAARDALASGNVRWS